MSLKTCSISMLELTKLDNKDINDRLVASGFDLDYHYHTTTTAKGIDFQQWLDAGSRLALRNRYVDFHALAHYVDACGVNTMGVEG